MTAVHQLPPAVCSWNTGEANRSHRLCVLSLPSRIFHGLDGMEILNTGSLSKLTFFNVSDTDYGNYTCVAINKLGSSNTSFLLYGKKLLVLRWPQTANDTFSTEKPTTETHAVYVLVNFYEFSTSVCLQFTEFCSQCVNGTKKTPSRWSPH